MQFFPKSYSHPCDYLYIVRVEQWHCLTVIPELKKICGLACADGDIRLRGGPNNSSGRVEVCKNKEWGTVNAYLWSSADARVVCRQLGFSTHSE